MKTYVSSIFGVLVLACSLFMAGCKEEDPVVSETEVERATRILTEKEWTMASVTVDGVNQNAMFAGLKLNFGQASVSATPPGPIWPATTDWAFTGGGVQQFETGSGLLVTIQTLEDSGLTLALNWDKITLNGGKQTSIKGQHVFSFTR
jgi:hypothetical protein